MVGSRFPLSRARSALKALALATGLLAAGPALAPAGIPAPLFCTPMTDSRIEFGSGSGRSTKPRTGRTIRKWAK